MRHAILVLLLFGGSASAQSITPAFTQGSMQATTTTTQTIEETIAHEVYGSAVTSYSGENVRLVATSQIQRLHGQLPLQVILGR